MKVPFYVILALMFAGTLFGQQATNGAKFSAGVTVRESFKDLLFTTPAYQEAAADLIILEANRVAEVLNLPEQMPITKSNLVAVYVPSPSMAHRLGGAMGNITTSNYTYYISIGNRFSLWKGKTFRNSIICCEIDIHGQ